MKIVRYDEEPITRVEIFQEIDHLRELGHEIKEPEDAELQYIIDMVETEEQGFYNRAEALDYVIDLIFETLGV